jgi:GNAT superfamily N-acetyltransferase
MSTPPDIQVRHMIMADASVLASAFASMSWQKPMSLFARYLAQQDQGEREVWVALVDAELAGYVTISYCPSYPPLRGSGLPEIQDLNVLPPFRRRRVASCLMDCAEQAASFRANEVGLSVGLHPGYRAAQRLYVLRGYVPDANGVTYQDRFIAEGESLVADDDLVLHFTKALKRTPPSPETGSLSGHSEKVQK